MLIDFHTHCFPDALAPRAMEKLAKAAGSVPYTDGTVSDLRRKMAEFGVDRSVICNIATNPKQQTNVNNFAIEVKNAFEDLIPLGSVHPESDCIGSELERIKSAGLVGVKLHPDYMGYTFDDPVFRPILGICEELGLFVVIHAGFDVISPDKYHATPEMIVRVKRDFPRLRLVAAHFGSNRLWDDVSEYLAGEDIYIDTSLVSESRIPREAAERIILKHDPEKILFASDLPWDSPKICRDFIDFLRIRDSLKENIFHTNAERLLGEI